CAVERSEMRLQQLQDQAFPLAEISLAEDAELSRPAPVAVEGDVDLVRDAVFSVVQVEVRLDSQAAREDVGERDRPRTARLPSPKLDGARASPPSVVHAAPPGLLVGAWDVNGDEVRRGRELEERRELAMRNRREPIEQVGRERRRFLDRVRLLKERENRLVIAPIEPHHRLRKIRRNANRHKARAAGSSWRSHEKEAL